MEADIGTLEVIWNIINTLISMGAMMGVYLFPWLFLFFLFMLELKEATVMALFCLASHFWLGVVNGGDNIPWLPPFF